ncbi:MAG: lipopolysaccharide exporter [Solirubrobacteraceae bacterium]|nr:lipopolysaccharide exporter [Solirubrobacteraceae bacterium]
MSDPGDDVRTNAELTEAAAGGLRWIMAARVITEVALLGSMVLLARLIPPSEFGIFAIVVIVQELALTMPMEGIGGALVQRRSIAREHLQAGLVLSLAVGVALALATLLLAVVAVDPLFGARTASLVMLAAPWYLLGALYAIPMAVLRRRLDFRRLSIIDLALYLSRAATMIVLAAIGLDAEALILGSMAGMAVAVAVALAFVPLPPPRWRRREMRELLPYGGPAALACVAWTGFRNGDYAIVGAQLGTAQAGFYWRGYQLAVEYQRKISTVMTQMAFPVLSRTEDAASMLALRRRMVQLLTVMLFPLLVLLAVLAPVAVPWLFGAPWQPAVLPTQILALGGAAVLVTDAVGSALMAAGRSRALLGYGVAHFVAYAGAVVVVARHGIAAVALAAAIVHCVFLVIAYHVLLRGERQHPLAVLGGDLAPAGVCCLALVAVALPADRALGAIGAPALVHMLAVAALGGAAYLAALRVGYPASWSDLATGIGRLLPRRRIAAGLRRLSPAFGRSGGPSS